MQSTSRRDRFYLAAVLAAGVLLRLLLIPARSDQSIDLAIFLRWVEVVRERGLALVYLDSGIDYPPVVIYLLALASQVDAWLPDGLRANQLALVALLRLVPALAECGTLGLIAYALRGQPAWRRLAGCAAFALNPALLYMAATWTQFDAVFTFLLLISIILLARGRVLPAWLAYTLALATKPQAIALAPLILCVSVQRYGLGRTLLPAAASVVAALALLWPWLSAGQLGSVYRAVTAIEPYIDLSGFNAWYVVYGGQVHNLSSEIKVPLLPVTTGEIGGLLFVAGAALVCALVWRQSVQRLGLAAAALTLGLFLFAPGVHERFLYPVLPFALLTPGGWDAPEAAAASAGRWLWLAAGMLTLTFGFNLIAVASFAPALWTNLFALAPPYTTLQALLKSLALLAAVVNLAILGYWLCVLALSGQVTAGESQAR